VQRLGDWPNRTRLGASPREGKHQWAWTIIAWACAFAVNPARERALRASGLTAQRRQARRGFHAKNAKLLRLQVNLAVNLTCDVLAENPDARLGQIEGCSREVHLVETLPATQKFGIERTDLVEHLL
jgi:hypothetical protein